MKKLSTLFFATVFSFVAYAQIPNPGFENWTSHTGYNTPDGWGNLDSAGSMAMLITCAEGTPGYGGSSHMIQLTTKSLTFGTTTIAIPGIAVSGQLAVSGTSFAIQSGFPMSTRPQSLTGEWQYLPSGTDQGNIMVLLTKWDVALSKRDTVAFTNELLSGSVTTMAPFSFDLSYLTTDVPDTGVILLASGMAMGGTDGSYLYADDLAFAGTANSVATINNIADQISISPNPAKTSANISYNSKSSGTVKLSIADVTGKMVKELTFNKNSGANNFKVDVNDMAPGMYFVKVIDGQGVGVKKLIVE